MTLPKVPVFLGLLVSLACLAAGPAAAADFQAGMAAYERGDWETALAEWQPLAEQGMAEAQYDVGLLHLQGRGVPEDATEAHAWFLRAAEGGYARAQYRVAEMYEAGEGVRRDRIQAHLWFRMAGDQKYPNAKKRRKRVAKQMTPEQIAMADMLARHRRADAKAAARSKR